MFIYTISDIIQGIFILGLIIGAGIYVLVETLKDRRRRKRK